MGGMRLGVDVGGTFTDLVALGAGNILTAKVPSAIPDLAGLRGGLNMGEEVIST